tara:strand:- start:131 stop:1066 length:936 start_codon:yes stop_codon:yes gene_type:complete
MKNIFFCITPLECYIASKIITSKNIDKKDCEFFFFNSIKNNKISYYYELLQEKCSIDNFYFLNKRYPQFLIDIKKYFKDKKYLNVYIAALDSIIIHMALSTIDFKNLFTYDNGLVNILKNSVYDKPRQHPFHKRLLYKIYGNKYSTIKIIEETQKHYTIFKNFKNVVSNNTEYLNLFSLKPKTSNGKRCSIILGSVFSEYYLNQSIDLMQKRFQSCINNINGEVYFIKHPRDKYSSYQNINYINSTKIAEEIILDFLKNYQYINLYGFMSTTQFNLIEFDNIHHHFFINDELRVKEGLKLLSDKSISICKI